jgi:hypothetical protein
MANSQWLIVSAGDGGSLFLWKNGQKDGEDEQEQGNPED